ncbi:hypothetical protein GLOIN_2v1471395 [Rhizophagus irregularis DAOM 181602=DAOM 197198]|nr:hypothetical protein GLOIN_2v1471395 [Rhizophagus irregularis DAOM 181602=DAOM 197198]
MSSDKSEEIPWLEDLEVEEASSSEASGSKSLLLNNFIAHLATHRITEESHKRKMNEVQNNGQLSQLHIDEIIRTG